MRDAIEPLVKVGDFSDTTRKQRVEFERIEPARPSRSLVAIAITAVLMLAAATIEFVSYEHYFRRHVAPYYPANDDQLETFQWGYNNNEAFKTGFLHLRYSQANPLALPHSRRTGHNMKGPVIPILAMCAASIAGPHRFTVALVNFAYLLCGQLFLFIALRRRSGLSAALIASGLFLMSGTHYMFAGGLDDMRLDYSGMIMMGLTYLAVLQWIEQGRKKDLLIAGACLLLGVMTRSILHIYWLGTMLVVSVFYCAASLIFKSKGTRLYRNRSLLILACSALISAIYVAMNWHDFASYYINCKTHGEDAMRRRENHVGNLLDLMMYYPRSFVQHFQSMLCAFIGAAAAVIGGKSIRDRLQTAAVSKPLQVETAESPEEPQWLSPIIVLTLAIGITVLVCVTAYVPSPVVIGVLTMPLCVGLALTLNAIMSKSRLRKLPALLAVTLLGYGVWNFHMQYRHPVWIPHGDVLERSTVNQVFDLMLPEVNKYHRPIRILWGLVHGGLNEKAFEIYSWEHLGKSLNVDVDASYVAAYPKFSWSGVEQHLATADFVIIPIVVAQPAKNEFEYDGMKSLREYLPKILSTLKLDGFRQLGTYRLHEGRPPILGVFERDPAAKQM